MPEPEPAELGGHARPGLDHDELPDVREAEDDEAHAQGHDQRVDPEDADADAGERGPRAPPTTSAIDDRHAGALARRRASP